MPIEIRELVIKVTISEEGKGADDSKDLQEIKTDLVEECIEKIMARLETTSER